MVSGMVTTPTRAQTTVKIGLLSPLTGALGSLGAGFQSAAELAVSDLNAANSDFTFELVVQDTETDPTKAQNAATVLVDAGVSGVVGGAASSVTLGANPTFEAAKTPQISYASTSPALTTEDDNDYLFRVVPSDAFQGKAAAQLAYNELELRNVAIIGIDDPYGQGLVDAFANAFEALGGTVPANIAYDQVTTVDFSSPVTTLVDATTDGIFVVAFLTDGAAILNELNSQAYSGQILGTDGIADNEIFNEEGFVAAAANGVVGTVPAVTGTTSFRQSYANQACSEPGIFVAESYDATMLIGLAAVAASSAVGEDVRDNLRATALAYSGASGSIVFDTNGDRDGGTYDLWEFKDGVRVTTGSWKDDVISLTPPAALSAVTFPSSCDTDDDGLPLSMGPVFLGLFSLTLVALVVRKRTN